MMQHICSVWRLHNLFSACIDILTENKIEFLMSVTAAHPILFPSILKMFLIILDTCFSYIDDHVDKKIDLKRGKATQKVTTRTQYENLIIILLLLMTSSYFFLIIPFTTGNCRNQKKNVFYTNYKVCICEI